jgi:glycosyltransferase 2 family protein
MKKILARAIPITFYLALGIFLLVYLRSVDYEKLAAVRINWVYLALATVVSLGYRYWMVLIWLVLLRGIGLRKIDSISEMTFVYARAWLGRYIPGTAPWILGKIYFASRRGVSKAKLAVSSFLEGGLQVIVLLVVGIVVILLDPRTRFINPWLSVTMVLVAIAGLVALAPPVFNRIASLGYQIVRKRSLDKEHLPGWEVVGRGAGLYAIGALFSGLSMAFIAFAVWPDLSWSSVPFIIGASNLASAVSMIAIFAPSGIGVREAILVALLSLVMPTELALIAAIVIRLWSVAIDFAFVGIARLQVLISRRRKGPADYDEEAEPSKPLR